jgi:hypothetical protein
VTLTVEDDFREFVAARWSELEGVAHVVTLDAAAARRVTTDALARLHQHWRDALDEGRPGLAARGSVLRDALAAAAQPSRSRSATAGSTDSPTGAPPAPWAATTAPDDPVLRALEQVLHAASPLDRALVGAASVWAAGPDELADLLGTPAADLHARATDLRGRLTAAHDAARAADGLAPAEWALDADLDAVVEHLAGGHGDPPDPAALVAQRRRSVRRRSLLAGGAGAAALGTAARWVVRDDPAPTASRRSAAAPTGLPGPDDPSWLTVARWAPRGRLTTDPRVQGLVIGAASGPGRLLWADDLAGQRLVVAATLNPGTEDVILQAWQGAAGSDPASLQEVALQNPFVPGTDGVVPLAVPTFPGSLLLVLARPGVTRADYSQVVVPDRSGTIGRTWSPVSLLDGIGSSRWDGGAGPALRVRCAAFDGPAVGTAATFVEAGGTDGLAGFAEETTRLVAGALGVALDAVRTEVAVDAKVGGGVIDPRAFSPQGGDGRVRVLRTTTPDGAVIRTTRVVDDGRSRMNWLDLEPPTVLPADLPPDAPGVWRLDDARPGVGRYLVVAPGAARVQLLSTAPNAYPVSKVTRTRAGVAVVDVVNANDAAAFRLVRRDAAGRRLGGDVPPTGRELLDLWPSEPTRVVLS